MTAPAHFAHSVDGAPQERWELLDHHLRAVAERCAEFADRFGAAALGRAAGLLHDAGKFRAAFQHYIRKEGPAAEHSICGAVLAAERFYPGPIGRLLAYAVAGHHAGLPDAGSADDSGLDARLRRGQSLLADMAPWPAELSLPDIPRLRPPAARADWPYAVSFLTRMLFSALADADFLQTERFYRPDQAEERRRIAEIPLAALRERLDRTLEEVAAGSAAAPEILAHRTRVLARCREMAAAEPGVFSLSVPTGGGKTLSSLAFALHHAEANGLRRVIYVIPYTSIIEQTADIFRRAFGDLAVAVVEHHSTAAPVEAEDTMGPGRLGLAVENWDAPVIVTTSVQFFESLHAARPAACRKLHNIAGSVVVLDEVQALPVGQLGPCVRALRELAERFRTTVLLCSATLPDLRHSPNLGAGFASVTEIIDDVDSLFANLARVSSERAGRLDDNDLVARLVAERQVLCVVDSRAHAATLHGRVAEAGTDDAFHLSASMCPAHRREVLGEVRARLKGGLPCRLVATPVIEAGVDVDFPVVYRAAAGIDALAQAAGRCNRNGQLARGRFVVFDGARPSRLGDLVRRRALAAPLLAEDGDPLALDIVRRYFATLLAVEKTGMDAAGILRRIDDGLDGLNWPFRSIARDFRMIDQDTRPVIVPWRGQAAPLVAEVEAGRPSLAVMRGLQQVSVAAYPDEIAKLRTAGALREFGPDGRFLLLTREECYGDTGLRAQED